jgi:hypothetical protein
LNIEQIINLLKTNDYEEISINADGSYDADHCQCPGTDEAAEKGCQQGSEGKTEGLQEEGLRDLWLVAHS